MYQLYCPLFYFIVLLLLICQCDNVMIYYNIDTIYVTQKKYTHIQIRT